MAKKFDLIARLAQTNVGVSDRGQFYIQKGMGTHHARWVPVIRRRADMVMGKILAQNWENYKEAPTACVVVNYATKIVDFRPDENRDGFQFDVDAMTELDCVAAAL